MSFFVLNIPTAVHHDTNGFTSTTCQTEPFDSRPNLIDRWTKEASEENFLDNFAYAIDNGILDKGNICFALFAELLRKLRAPGSFVYAESTLLWWLCGLKQYGGKWLTNMQGVPGHLNFAPQKCVISLDGETNKTTETPTVVTVFI